MCSYACSHLTPEHQKDGGQWWRAKDRLVASDDHVKTWLHC